MGKYNLNVSSATIRNDMAELEKQGYIMQPHKSAGRIPTDKGYRFFVNELMRRFELSEKERKLLREEVMRLKHVHEQLGRSISNLLAQVSGQAAFALLPQDSSATGLSHIIGEPELTDPKMVKDMTKLFENIDEYSSKLEEKSRLRQGSGGRAEVTAEAFIGEEAPIPVPKNLSLVVSNVKFKDGKKGVIGVVGPKRMSYAKNLSLLEYLAKLISGAAVIFLIIKI